MQKIIISICIVSYRAATELKSALASIYKYPPSVSFEIIVVDNNEDGSFLNAVKRKYPKVRYIRARRNGGYGAGNNLAVQNAIGEFVFVVNPDIEVKKDTINILYKFLRNHPQAGAVGTAYQVSGRNKIALGTGELTPIRGLFSLSFLNKLLPGNYFSKKYYLTEFDRERETQVFAVAGSAALFRRKALVAAGMYDEKLFLYYEESDLGRRLINAGWELWITPMTTIIHKTASSTKSVRDSDIKSIFLSSRFYYFKKHFGILNALLVEAFARFGKRELTIFSIFALGFFLRVYRLSDNMVFHGELGDNYLAMKNIAATGVIPLLGPPTSHSWLSFGPLYYWIFTPVLWVLRFDPLSMAYFFAIVHSLLIFINYWTVSKMFSQKTAFISSFIIAISPSFMYFTREARFFSLVLILFYPFFYFFCNKRYILAGVLFGIILNFHLTPLIYLPSIFIYLWRKNNTKIKLNFGKFLLGAAIPQIPFLVASLSDHGKMLFQSIIWIPYRILGFVGIVPKNTVSSDLVSQNSTSFLGFVNSAFLSTKIVPSLLVAVIFSVAIITVYHKKQFNYRFRFLVLLLGLGYLAIFIHGDPPIHYYVPLLPPLIIIISEILGKIANKVIVVCFLFLLFGINASFFFSNNWFYIPQNKFEIDHPVPYSLQKLASQAIVVDSGGYPFSLKRVGPYDYFDENYAQNYHYLLWLNGNEPKKGQLLTYTIYEGKSVTSANETIIFDKGGIVVTR